MLKFEIDIKNGLLKNKSLFLEEEMYETSFDHSTFLSYYELDDTEIEKNHYTTLKCFDDDNLVGILILPHLYEDQLKVNFNGIHKRVIALAEIQMYVKPARRKEGIAKEMVIFLNKFFFSLTQKEFNKDTIVLVQCVDDAFPIVSKYLTSVNVLNAWRYPSYEFVWRLSRNFFKTKFFTNGEIKEKFTIKEVA